MTDKLECYDSNRAYILMHKTEWDIVEPIVFSDYGDAREAFHKKGLEAFNYIIVKAEYHD